ncbi:MAG: hypothetical protein ACREOZ_01685 [Gloeomargaritales cyanobacterium]
MNVISAYLKYSSYHCPGQLLFVFYSQSSPPSPGLVTFIHQEIISDIMGLTISLGLFGLLKRRAKYIESVYFDGYLWI